MRRSLPSLAVLIAIVGLTGTLLARQDPQPPAQQDPPQQQQQPRRPMNPNAGFLGARFSPITDEIAEELKLDSQAGVIVVDVMEDSPAQKAGLQGEDIIRQIDGKKIEDVDEFSRTMSQTKPGQELKLTILRQGKEQELPVTLGKRPPQMNQGAGGAGGGGGGGGGGDQGGSKEPPATKPN